MAEMLDYSADEMIGRPLYDFVDDEWRDVAQAKLQRRREGLAERHEFRFRRKDGSELWVLVSASPTLDERGDFVGAMALMTDLTDRRQLEREVLTAAEQERQRIGQDLHDTVGQMLTGVSFMSKSLAGRLARELPQALPRPASQGPQPPPPPPSGPQPPGQAHRRPALRRSDRSSSCRSGVPPRSPRLRDPQTMESPAWRAPPVRRRR
jgi:PAS domain S-box-containing protein